MIHSLAAARLAIAIATSKRPDVSGLSKECAIRVAHIAAELGQDWMHSNPALRVHEALRLLCVEKSRDERDAIIITCPLVEGHEWAVLDWTAEIYDGAMTRQIDLGELLGEEVSPLADILSANRYRSASAVLALHALITEREG